MTTAIVRGMYSNWDRDMPEGEVPYGMVDNAVRILMHGYEDGDSLREAWSEAYDLHCGDCNGNHSEEAAQEILANLWIKYNFDGRPDAETERSISVGDVVEIAFNEADIRRYAVKPVGFERLIYA